MNDPMMLTGAAVGIAAVTARNQIKKKLAKILVKALSEFFVVDAKNVKSNLLTDTKIVLKSLLLKPQKIFPGYCLIGELDRVEFNWSWGGSKDGSTAYVRKTVLTIQGAKFHIVEDKSAQDPPPSDSVPTESMEDASLSSDDSDTEESSKELPKNVMQIIDNLNIEIVDIQVIIPGTQSDDDPEPQNTVLEAKSIKLVSLGRERMAGTKHSAEDNEDECPPPPLSQRIFLESLCLYIINMPPGRPDSSKPLYVVEPFGYEADVRRISGRRFLDGLDTGLEIVGENRAMSDIVVHAGTTQIQTLLRLKDIMDGSKLTDSESSNDSSNDNKKPADDVEMKEVVTDTGDVEIKIVPTQSTEKKEDIEEDNDPHASRSTLFSLPFPSIKIVLPNDSVIRSPFWSLLLGVDGKECTLNLTGGVEINDGYPFIKFGSSSKLVVDLSGDNLVLQHFPLLEADIAMINQESSKAIARVQWQESEMNKILEGLEQIAEVTKKHDKNKSPAEEKKTPKDDSSSPNPWSVVLDGTISIRMEGGTSNADWIEASLDSVTFVAPDRPGGLPSQIKLGEATVGPSSFGDISFRVGAVTFSADSIPSIDVIGDVQRFVIRVLHLAD